MKTSRVFLGFLVATGMGFLCFGVLAAIGVHDLPFAWIGKALESRELEQRKSEGPEVAILRETGERSKRLADAQEDDARYRKAIGSVGRIEDFRVSMFAADDPGKIESLKDQVKEAEEELWNIAANMEMDSKERIMRFAAEMRSKSFAIKWRFDEEKAKRRVLRVEQVYWETKAALREDK